MKDFARSRWFHVLLLLTWVAVGAILRFTRLTAKPPWTDEFATIVFSLGQSFASIPLDQPIALDTLLLPLHLNPQASFQSVAAGLLQEDVHPPLYFVLAHAWMKLFLTKTDLVSIWVARSLPAVLGVISIPATFGLGWLAFRSPYVSHLAAAMMAVSPFGIFLAQEARHYTLAILWVIAALSCLIVVLQFLDRRATFPAWLGMTWVVVNALGIATHYFFLLTLAASAFVLLGLGWSQSQKDGHILLYPQWQRVYAVALSTAGGILVWLPVWQGIRGHAVTQWIQNSDPPNFLRLISPIFQAIAAWITMLALLPVEADALPIVLAAGFMMIVFFLWAIPTLHQGLQMQRSQPLARLGVQSLAGFVLGAIGLFFLITYGLGSDLTRGARYNFVYFPAVIVLSGASLAAHWQTPPWLKPAKPQQHFCPQGKRAVGLILLVGLLSGVTVVSNLGYQKYYRPDLLVPQMQQASQRSTLIATTHTTLVQVGEIMGLGWQFQIHPSRQTTPPQFLLVQADRPDCIENCPATQTLAKQVANLPKPLDLWLVNFRAPVQLASQCQVETHPQQPISGYDYQVYHCPAL